jgi:hypothetical protein
MSDAAARPLDGKAFAIGVLSVTACILLVGFLLVSQTPAYAIGMNDRGGDYILLTQQRSTTSEAVVLIDAAAKRMIIYEFDYNKRTLDLLRTVPLDQLPKPRTRESDQPPSDRRRR